jgi:hypothetical protein
LIDRDRGLSWPDDNIVGFTGDRRPIVWRYGLITRGYQ